MRSISQLLLRGIGLAIVLCILASCGFWIAMFSIPWWADTVPSQTHTVRVGTKSGEEYFLTPSQYRWTFTIWWVIVLLVAALILIGRTIGWYLRESKSPNKRLEDDISSRTLK
jgi:hypothetical protein